MISIDQIIGQPQAQLMLRMALEKGKINHAYLFTGPAGVGKKTAARAFAREMVLADDPEGEMFFREGIHPDLMIVGRLENKSQIGIEQINRGIEPWLAMKPYRARHRVVVIAEANLMSLPAANALLKTLEEPPAYTVMILTSDEPNLLETIVSRCQLIRFRPLQDQHICDLLIEKGFEPGQAMRLARLGQGSITASLHMAGAEGLENTLALAQDSMLGLLQGTESEVVNCAEQMEKDPYLYASLFSCLLRDISIFQSTHSEELLVTGARLEFFQKFPDLDVRRVSMALQNMDQLRKQYRGPINPLLLSIGISYQLQDALK